MDSDTNHLYIAPSAPHGPPDTSAATISVGKANGQVENSLEKATLPIPQLAADLTTTGYIMPSFTNTIVGVGPICDADCTVVFTKQDVTLLSPKREAIITGWREKKLPKLCSFALKPTEEMIKNHTSTRLTTPAAHSAYNRQSVEVLVPYMHTAAGFLVKDTCIIAIKKVTFRHGQD